MNHMNRIHTLLTLLILSTIISCSYTEKIKDGRTAFARKQFSVASEMLPSEYEKEKSRVEKGKIAYLIGESYRRMNKPEKSLEWYKKAMDNQYGIDAMKQYAFGLKRAEKYTEAKDAFKELGLEIGSPYEYRREITACKLSESWLEEGKSGEYTLIELPLNTSNAEYAPTLFEDGKMVFTSDRKMGETANEYKWTGNYYSNLYLYDPVSDEVTSFDDRINSSNNEGTLTFNEDFTEVIFSRCYSEVDGDQHCKLMTSTRQGDTWSIPIKINFVDDKANYAHPTLSADGSVLYFSCNHSDGWGGYDIYRSERNPDGWDPPIVLGRTVNTDGNEKFPVIDGDTLYFSSDRHPGMGGLDIFRTFKMDNDTWSPIHNLKSPINSGADDFAFTIDRSENEDVDILQAGYFSSSRPGGSGNDDIYRFEKRYVEPPVVVVPEPDPKKPEPVKPKPIEYKMILNGYVVEKIFQDPNNPDSKMLGKRPLPGSQVFANFNGQRKTFAIGEDGKFTLEMEVNTDYSFSATKADYLTGENRFSSKGIGKDPNNPTQEFEVEIVLDKIFKNKEIVLEDIYYDYDKSDIRSDATRSLDNLATILFRNPQINIQLSAHTDCRGADGYNKTLSQKRAESAVNYLITKGIQPTRLSAVGYGKDRLRIECQCSKCTEDEHQLNRRTTFKVVD